MTQIIKSCTLTISLLGNQAHGVWIKSDEIDILVNFDAGTWISTELASMFSSSTSNPSSTETPQVTYGYKGRASVKSMYVSIFYMHYIELFFYNNIFLP